MGCNWFYPIVRASATPIQGKSWSFSFVSVSFLYVGVCCSSKPQSEQNFSHGEARPFPPAPVRMPK